VLGLLQGAEQCFGAVESTPCVFVCFQWWGGTLRNGKICGVPGYLLNTEV
jgi:hypothetical protein